MVFTPGLPEVRYHFKLRQIIEKMKLEELKFLYDKLIEQFPEIQRKGKTTPYTSINGYMFSFLSKEGQMGLRLSKTDRENFISNYQATPMMQHGRVMKEYVQVPEKLLVNTTELMKYLQSSYVHVSSLKPKPSKK